MHVPTHIIKNQSMFQNGESVLGLSVAPSLIFNYFMNVLICPIFTNCSQPPCRADCGGVERVIDKPQAEQSALRGCSVWDLHVTGTNVQCTDKNTLAQINQSDWCTGMNGQCTGTNKPKRSVDRSRLRS